MCMCCVCMCIVQTFIGKFVLWIFLVIINTKKLIFELKQRPLVIRKLIMWFLSHLFIFVFVLNSKPSLDIRLFFLCFVKFLNYESKSEHSLDMYYTLPHLVQKWISKSVPTRSTILISFNDEKRAFGRKIFFSQNFNFIPFHVHCTCCQKIFPIQFKFRAEFWICILKMYSNEHFINYRSFIKGKDHWILTCFFFIPNVKTVSSIFSLHFNRKINILCIFCYSKVLWIWYTVVSFSTTGLYIFVCFFSHTSLFINLVYCWYMRMQLRM